VRTVHVAETVFRWLMGAYPARFRRAHGLAMFELFRDEARDAHDRRGTIGLVALLARTLVDTVAIAPLWWLRREPAAPTRLTRPTGPARSLSGFGHDIRIAVRHLLKAPGFTCVAVLMLATGIGINVTIFSLVNAVVLRPLAMRNADTVVRLVRQSKTGGVNPRRFSAAELEDYRRRSTTLEEVSAVNLATFVLDSDGLTDQLVGEVVSSDYLSLLGVAATQGRLLNGRDNREDATPAVIISDTLWRRRFDGGAVVGRSILLNRVPYTIVGVAESAAIGSFIGAPVDLWVPLETSGLVLGPNWRTDRNQRELMAIARLRPGVTRQRAQAELQSIAAAVAREFTPELAPLVDIEPAMLATGDQRRLASVFLSLLLGLVALVLLIACANVANLLLARVLGRRRELAVRVALGASRARLARMLIVEGALIAGAGGAAALVLSMWTSRLFANLRLLPTLSLRLDLRPDARVIAVTAIAALASAVVLGMIGAMQAINPNIAPALKEDSAAAIGGRATGRLRGALATVQIIVSLLLLIGAALFTRSVRRAAAIDLGFDPAGVVALDVGAFGGRTNDQSLGLFNDILRRAARTTAFDSAAVSTRAPLDSSTPLVRVNPREAVAPGDRTSATVSFLIVSGGYFDVVKTPLVAGRTFLETDDSTRPPVAIVNETLAGRLWPDADAIGRSLWLDRIATTSPGTRCVVVGVAKDSKYLTLGEERQGHVYLPFTQQPRRGMTVLVRSRAPTDRVLHDLQELFDGIDPHLQGFFGRTLIDHVGVSLLPIRIAASLTTAVAALALGLALVGLYSLVSFLVAERTHEIGLRMALGAGTGDVLGLVLGYGVKLTGVGLAIGVPVAAASTRLLRSLLYGVSPDDPFVFAAVSAVLMVVAAAASYIPARRAMGVDPIAALRNE
jgi:macrolide transport system ATP-binding/permease protein